MSGKENKDFDLFDINEYITIKITSNKTRINYHF